MYVYLYIHIYLYVCVCMCILVGILQFRQGILTIKKENAFLLSYS